MVELNGTFINMGGRLISGHGGDLERSRLEKRGMGGGCLLKGGGELGGVEVV